MSSRRSFALAALSLSVACSQSSTVGSVVAAGGPMPARPGATISGDVPLNNAPPFHYPANAPVAKPDPRIGLKPGASAQDAGAAAWNMVLLSNSPASNGFTGRGATGSDLAFTGKYAIQGNYRGFQIWDISNPRAPQLVVGFLCPASQGDPSVYKNLVFISGEA